MRYFPALPAIIFVCFALLSCSDDPVSPPPEKNVIENYRLLINTRDGLFLWDRDSTVTKFNDSNRRVEVIGSRIFLPNWGNHRIDEYDTLGNFVQSIPYPDTLNGYFAMLPDDRVALFNNSTDSIYISNSSGNLVAALEMPGGPDNENQNLDGIVVGNTLVISENGNNQLMSVDLTSYEVSIFRDFQDYSGWLGAIDYFDGTYYLCQDREIWSFTDGGNVTLVAEVDTFNITGIVVDGNYALVTLNFADGVYRVDLTTGNSELLIPDMDYPQDIEILE